MCVFRGMAKTCVYVLDFRVSLPHKIKMMRNKKGQKNKVAGVTFTTII